MNDKPKPTDRVRLEAAVTKVGRAYDELVRVIEKSSELEAEDVRKSFAFLATVHGTASTKADLSLATALAANGGFSLDKVYEPSVHVPTPRPAPGRERIVGEQKAAAVAALDDDDVGFIDD